MIDPHAEYLKRLEAYLRAGSAKERAHILTGNLKMAVVIMGFALGWLSLAKHLVTPYLLAVPVALYSALAIFHEYAIRKLAHAETAAASYRQGIARIEDRWPGTGQTGERFKDEKHVYSSDLDLFGRGSLFELLSTARLPMGENYLATWLLSPSPKEAILERQQLIAELREKLDLREYLAVIGKDLRGRLDPAALVIWAEGKPILPPRAWRVAAIGLATSASGAVVLYSATSIYWPLLCILMLEMLIRRHLRPRAQTVIEGLACNAEGLLLFADILQRLEKEEFTLPRLRRFAVELNGGGQPASRMVRKLARIVYWIDGQHSLLAHLAELPLLYTVQVGFAAEAWRRVCGRRMRIWIDIAGEIEALLSLAAYSFEHPGDPFPQFADDSQVLFDGDELGHPLIPASQCVSNSLQLDSSTRVLLVSGSNMSGKSTFLRVAGINAVLAMAGAPVRGKSLRLTPLTLGSRIRSTDSLQEKRSSFFTEILHIREVFQLTGEKAPLLFLFDELLEGTNSQDRRIGAEGLLRGLLNRGAIGIVTTHDLALTEITRSLGQSVRNVHFQDYVQDGEMRFDYKLQDGVVARSNAIELMRLIGLEV